MAKRTINLQALPSNDRDPESRKIESIIKGKSKKQARKKNFAMQVRDIGNGIFQDTMVPMIKNLLYDSFTTALKQMLGMSGGGGAVTKGHTAYNRQYRRTYPHQKPVRRGSYIDGPILEDVFYEIREDAEAVLGRMMERVADYGKATVGDWYTFSDLPSNVTHQRWGWTDLYKTEVLWTNDGFMIDFPEPIDLG